MSDIPFARLEPMKPPFNSKGIDSFGPITIKQHRPKLKQWETLRSSFTTGAIHLEVVEGYDTDSFNGSLQRFVNRRGDPEYVYSDCGTNLKGTTSKLNIGIQYVKKYSYNEPITWHFNPPPSLHMVEIWERIIRTVQNVMFSMCKKTVLTVFQLMTIFIEIEVIVSNRPLTYVSGNLDDLEPLTKNYLLLGRCNGSAVAEENNG